MELTVIRAYDRRQMVVVVDAGSTPEALGKVARALGRVTPVMSDSERRRARDTASFE
jgi:FAD/FMN-containing dehydrogenase